jgi:hypothetical protein
MQKRTIIKKIKSIIADYGTFNIQEVENCNGVVVNEMGKLVSLAEAFTHTGVEVAVYEPSGFSSDGSDEHEILYEDLSKEILEELLVIAELYEVDQEKTVKRCSN